MARIRTKDRSGAERDIHAAEGFPLMEALRDEGMGVDGTCGGVMSCGTCHVYVDAACAAGLPEKSDDEQMMLEAIGEFVTLRPTSRLSCQILVKPEMDGVFAVEVAPST